MVTAYAVGRVSRQEAGLRSPRSRSSRVHFELGGVAVHYGGPAPRIDSHDDCARTLRAWQDFHMDARRWTDIAYSFAFCQHGYIFECRGWGIRTAANATNDANTRFLAAVWLGGEEQEPTLEARSALAQIVLDARERGAGAAVQPHSIFRSTSCPGPALRELAFELHMKPIDQPIPEPAFDPEFNIGPKHNHPCPTLEKGDSGPGVASLQTDLRRHGSRVEVDGDFGPNTANAVVSFQQRTGLVVDAIVGSATWRALHSDVI